MSASPPSNSVNILKDAKDYDRVIDILTSEVDELKNEISQLRVAADRVEQQQFEKDEAENISEYDLMLLGKERRLKSELDIFSELNPIVEPVNENVCDLVIDDEFNKVWSNINHEMSFMEKKKLELQHKVETLNINIERDHEIATALTAKIEVLTTELQTQQLDDDGSDEEVRILNEKIRHTKHAINDISQSMADFLTEHFSQPIPYEEGDQDYVPLHNIIQSITDAYSKNPSDPYVDVSDQWWPRHIEMLLRYDIIVKHKTDPNKVRIEFYDS